jgi:two-component system chemotaxis response regulator CheB
MKPTKIAIADDSDIARAVLRQVIGAHPELALVAEARSVEELETHVANHNPQVVTLDLLMPGRASLSAIRRLSERTSVVVVSDARIGSPLANESLAQGASAFVTKRGLGTPQGRAELVRALLSTGHNSKVDYLVAIAGSTGAMPALERFVHDLSTLDVAVVVVQHLPHERMASFADWLTSLGLPAKVAEQSLPLARGQALVAPGHHHMVVRGERAELDASAPVAGHRPSGDYLFRSLVPVAAQTMAVVLSGMGKDGSAGIAPLVAGGATCIVQRPDTCPVPAMPNAALDAAKGAAWPLAPVDIGAAIRGWLGGKRGG